MVKTSQFCTFHVDEFLFGIEVEKVQEVIKHLEMTRAPLAPRIVTGLINLRGQIVTAIELRRRLELKDRSSDSSPMNVIIRTDEGPVSLLVDAIGAVIDADEESFELPPETLKGISRELIRGTYKLKNKLLLIIDIEKALDISVS